MALFARTTTLSANFPGTYEQVYLAAFAAVYALGYTPDMADPNMRMICYSTPTTAFTWGVNVTIGLVPQQGQVVDAGGNPQRLQLGIDLDLLLPGCFQGLTVAGLLLLQPIMLGLVLAGGLQSAGQCQCDVLGGDVCRRIGHQLIGQGAGMAHPAVQGALQGLDLIGTQAVHLRQQRLDVLHPGQTGFQLFDGQGVVVASFSQRRLPGLLPLLPFQVVLPSNIFL